MPVYDTGELIEVGEWNRLLEATPASYTLWVDGSTYRAECNLDSGSDFSGTDAATVINDAIAQLTAGGIVHFKPGTYEINSVIDVVNEGVYLTGVMGHHSSSATGRANSASILKATTSSINVVQWVRDSKHLYFGGIKDMHIYGQSDNSITGITAVRLGGGCSDLLFQNVFIDLCDTYGFNITANQGKTWNVWMVNCLVETCSNGFYLHDTLAYDAPPVAYDVYDVTTKIIDRINIVRCHTWGNENDVEANAGEIHNVLIGDCQFYGADQHSTILGGNVRRVRFRDNRVYDWGSDSANTYDGLYIQDSVNYVNVVGNTFGDHWESDARYSLSIVNTTDNISVFNNQFANTADLVNCTSSGENIYIQNNPGYNPIGVIATPFDTTNDLIELNGDSAAPAASTTYTICHADILISSTNSGNNNNAIQIKDPGGNNINPSTLSTLDAYHIPVGHQINWGAYTGAAPTVVVSFV